MKAEPPISPFTQKHPSVWVDSIDSKDIIQLYKDQLGYDVSNYFKKIPKVDVYQCTATFGRFYYPFTLEGDGIFYADLQKIKESEGGDYYRHWEYDHRFAYDHIKEGEKMLEIGCGTGSFLEKMKTKTDQLFGLELNREAVKVCQNKGLKVYEELIQSHAKSKKEFYDVVCVFQVLEHVTAVKEFIDASLEVLKKGGKLIFGVPNNEPYFQRFDKYATLNLPPHHMMLFDKRVFMNLPHHFPMELVKTSYDTPGRVKADAYLRAKRWLNIKSLPQHHTIFEKVKMVSLAPAAVPLSILKHIKGGIPGAYIVVMFEKK
jgi:2-polyprenyl-3-methyl-5-hydroxy-6-metoxy-1,4-benzoquinol methylase